MAAVRGKDTSPEMLIRRRLHALGWRYRLHDSRLPGKPDLVFRSRRTVIFVNGCFWHGHDCHLFKWPKTEELFWRHKITSNVRRDIRVLDQLRQEGWRVAEVWECQLTGRERRPVDDVVTEIDSFLKDGKSNLVLGADRRVAIPDGASSS